MKQYTVVIIAEKTYQFGLHTGFNSVCQVMYICFVHGARLFMLQ